MYLLSWLLFSVLGANPPALLPQGGDQLLPARVQWVGNSYSGRDRSVLQDVEDLCVLPDGTLYTNVFWDEAGGNVQEYRDGDLTRTALHTHGWGYAGGRAVSANRKNLFIAQNVNNEGGGLKGDSFPPKGKRWSGVSRRLREDIQKPAPFSGGRGGQGDTLIGSFLPVVEADETSRGGITGLCASETTLYVADALSGQIRVYDAETMKPVTQWKFTRPDRIARDKAGVLWVSQKPEAAGGAWRIVPLTPYSRVSVQSLVLPPSVLPADFCIDAQNRLILADAGPDNNLKIYTNLDGKPRLAHTFGVTGGVFAKPFGSIGKKRFNRPAGVGADAAGNLYVAQSGTTSGGSTVLECYAPSGERKWVRYGLTFVDLPDAVEEADGTLSVYTKEKRFTLPASGEASYRAYTVHPARFSDDPRLRFGGCTAFVRELNGHRLLFVTDMTAEQLHVYRFDPAKEGEMAIPCALLIRHPLDPKLAKTYAPGHPEKGAWLWVDENGDGKISGNEIRSLGEEGGGYWTPDSKGDLWRINGKQIETLPLAEIGNNGIPHWNSAARKTYPVPAEFEEVRRLRFLPDTDTLILGGNRGAAHNQHWKPMGPIIAAYTGWKTGSPRKLAETVLPFEPGASGHESYEPISFAVAGDYVFVAYTKGLKKEGLTQAFVKVLRLSDLAPVGNLSSEAVTGEIGLLDLVESVQALRQRNGEYVIFLEDDLRAKTVVFRWKSKG